ncbi:MAG: ABC transporter substrate-binding protein [bacterium]
MIKPLMKFLPCLFGISFSSWSGFALSEVKKTEIAPHRVVSMSLASDEILLDIMPACGGYDRIVALSTFSDQPQSSNVTETAKIIRGRVHSELETIINLKPDLVIAASFNRQEVIQALRKKNIRVLTLDKFSSAMDIAQNITTIGEYTNCQATASALRLRFLQQLSEVQKKLPRKTRPLRLINYSPDMTIMAQKTLFDDLVTRAGGVNVASEKGLSFWPKIDAETLLSLRPDVVIITDQNVAEKEREIRNHPVWKKMVAVQKGRLIFIDPREALSTSHYFANAVRHLQFNLEKQIQQGL